MFQNLTKLTLGACLAAASILPVAAQRPGDPGTRQEFLAGYLNLTDAQKAQVKTLFDAAATARETARGQMESLRQELTAAVKANGPDATIDRIATAIGVLHGQSTAAEAKLQVKFRALLSDEQKTKLDQLDGRRPQSGRR